MYIKYTNKKFSDAFLSKGQVRISTFWDYKSNEKLEIGDSEEGQTGFIFFNNTKDPWEVAPELLDLAAMSSPGHSRYKESKIINQGDEGLIMAAGGFNTFMYSVTKADNPSKSLMEQFGYDTAIEIIDINKFAQFTSEALRQFLINELKVDKVGATRLRCVKNDVKYVKSKRRIVTPSTIRTLHERRELMMDDFFSKPASLSHQSEFRIAYFLMNPETEKYLSLDLNFPELRPVIINDAGIPRISTVLRLIDPSEFID